MATKYSTTIDVVTAVQFLQKRYADLQILAAKLVESVNTTKRPLPCKVISNYNQAVKEYLNTGKQVFDQLAAKGIVVDQIVYRDGKPAQAPDDASKILVQTLVSPLRPAIFVPGPECPAAVRFAGQNEAPLGIAPLVVGVIEASLAAGRAIGPWLMRTGGAAVLLYFTGEAVKATVGPLTIVRDTVVGHDPAALPTAYTKCIEVAIAAGVSPEKAGNDCNAKTAGNALGIFGWIGLGVVTLGAGAGLYWWFKRRGGGGGGMIDDAADDADADADEEYIAPRKKQKRLGRAAPQAAATDEDEDVANDVASAVADATPPKAKRKRKGSVAAEDYTVPGGELSMSDFGDVAASDTLGECPTI